MNGAKFQFDSFGEDLTHYAKPSHGLPIIIGNEGEGSLVSFMVSI
jgi:hypothetical protein